MAYVEELHSWWAEDYSLIMGNDGLVTYSLSNFYGLERYNDFIHGVFDQLEHYIDVKFINAERVRDMIGFWKWPVELDFKSTVDPNTDYAGFASYQEGDTWDIIVRNSINYFDDFNKYIILHEIGHALGLEHPFDNSDGDFNDELTGYDTVMSYSWARMNFFSQDDIDTLIGIWGSNTKLCL